MELTVNCDNAAAELLVIDSDFKLIAHGPSPLKTRVEPGIYALKAKIGSRVSERLEAIEPRAEPYAFDVPVPRFESPMPLDNTASSREDQRDAPDQFMRAKGPRVALHSANIGTSSVVLFIRDVAHTGASLSDEQRELYAKSFQGFRLLDQLGRQLVDFDAHSVQCLQNGYVGAHVQMAPGSYVLAWGHGREQTCLVVNAVRGWAIQIFLRLQPVGGDALHLRPDFCDAAFVYDRIDAGYSAAREDFRVMEAARIALTDRRPVAGGQKMRALLVGRCTNPMLNLYGGHLLITAANPDYDLLAQVITNTAPILGPLYPDLVALLYAYECGTGKRPLSFGLRAWPDILKNIDGPPLLTPSWDLLLRCAEAAEVDIESLPVFRAAGELAVSGIVLTWERSRRRFERRAPERGQMGSAGPANPGAVMADPAPAPAPQPARRSLRTLAKMLMGSVVRRSAGKIGLPRAAETTIANADLAELSGALPYLNVKVRFIDSPEAAAAAMRLLANKAPWDHLVRLLQREPHLLESLASFSPLQRDLVTTLARASVEPEVQAGIDAEHVASIMRAHRVPLTTLAGALRTLDIVAVSTDVIRRVKANL